MRQGTRRQAAAIAAATALVLTGCSATGTAGPATRGSSPAVAPGAGTVRLLDPARFEAASADRVLINVHVPDEGSLPGTDLALPYDEVTGRAADLPVDRATPLAIYCMSGNMSAVAGRELLDLGYTDVVELDGGMRAWQATGRHLEPASG